MGILAYVIILESDPWECFSVDLIDKMKCGFQPTVPEDAPVGIASIIEKCWQHNDTSQPSTSHVSRVFRRIYLENDLLDTPVEHTQNHDNMMSLDGISIPSETHCLESILNTGDVIHNYTPNISVTTTTTISTHILVEPTRNYSDTSNASTSSLVTHAPVDKFPYYFVLYS